MTPTNRYPFETNKQTRLPAGLEVNFVSTFRFIVLPTEVVKNYF